MRRQPSRALGTEGFQPAASRSRLPLTRSERLRYCQVVPSAIGPNRLGARRSGFAPAAAARQERYSPSEIGSSSTTLYVPASAVSEATVAAAASSRWMLE